MKNFLMVLFALGISATASAQKTAAPKDNTTVTAVDKAQINTEVQEYTGKSCTGKTSDYFKQQTEPDPTMAMMGGMVQGMMNQQFDAMLNGMANKGMEIRKVSAVQGGKRAYLFDKKAKQGFYLVMQLAGGSLTMYGCATR